MISTNLYINAIEQYTKTFQQYQLFVFFILAAGMVSGQGITNQPKSPSFSLAQNQATQLINNPQTLRFSAQPTFVQNPGGGQIITSGPTVLNVSQLQVSFCFCFMPTQYA